MKFLLAAGYIQGFILIIVLKIHDFSLVSCMSATVRKKSMKSSNKRHLKIRFLLFPSSPSYQNLTFSLMTSVMEK